MLPDPLDISAIFCFSNRITINCYTKQWSFNRYRLLVLNTLMYNLSTDWCHARLLHCPNTLFNLAKCTAAPHLQQASWLNGATLQNPEKFQSRTKVTPTPVIRLLTVCRQSLHMHICRLRSKLSKHSRRWASRFTSTQHKMFMTRIWQIWTISHSWGISSQ